MSNLNIFLSYSSLDSNYFQIPELAKRLEDFPTIKKVLFWDVDSGIDIVEYMEKSIETADIFILFCSENSSKSKSVEREWQAAYQLRKHLIPVIKNVEDIPLLLRSRITIKFTKENFDGFITELYSVISRISRATVPKEEVDLDQFNKIIFRISKIYEEITLEKLSHKTQVDIEELEKLLEEMIISKKIKAYIRRDYVIFEKEVEVELVKKQIGFKIFISYATLDSEYFQISNVVRKLEKKSGIKKAFYWERDGGGNIIDYMNDNLPLCNVFVMFCSGNAKESTSVKNEWQAAYQLSNDGVLKIIPVFEEKVYVPVILRNWLYVEFKRVNINGFVEELHREILR